MRLRRSPLPIFVTLALLCVTCTPQVVTITVTSPPETVVVTATPSPSPTPSPPGPKVLDICLVGEPDTLYLYGGSQLRATQHVMEAIYDGPIDHRGYAYQPVMLQKLPSLADGDAVTRTVYVRRGDVVLNVDGEVVDLEEGVRVRPSGCYTTGCEVAYDGGLVRMSRAEVTFSLRTDLRWSDGEPLTAEDSEFAFEVASDPATLGFRYLTDRTAYYRALDAWTTQWIGIPGFVDASYPLAFFPPLPRHTLEGRAPRDLARDDDLRRAPLGWGPFVVDEWVQGDYLALRPNLYYFRAAGGLPYLDQVVFKFKRDAEGTVAALLSGACDLGAQDAGMDAFLPLLVRAEDHGLLKVVSAPGNEWDYLVFGVETAASYDGLRALAQSEVRQAIALCIDRPTIAEEITFGRGVVPAGFVPMGHPLYAGEQVRHWPYDPGAGRSVLDELGWRDEDRDGVREAQGVDGVADGEPFAVTLLTSSDDQASLEAARMVRAQLADCGIRVTVEARPGWELLAEGAGGPIYGRRFDLAEMRMPLADPPRCDRYLSWEIAQQGGWEGINITGYANPDYDAACLAAVRALPGTAAYDRFHQQTQVLLSEDIPALPLFAWPRIALSTQEVQNFEMDPTSESELWLLEILDIERASAPP